ncbi:hypothetical protein ACIGW3_26000 [Streptomyces sp. NPDC053499]
MTPELLADINNHLGHITTHGLWTQQWGGDQRKPPQQHRQAS